MKTLKEQIANRCIYFNGIQNKKCDLGIEYDSVKLKDSKPFKWPCIKNCDLYGGKCDKRKFPTKDEIEKEIAEINELGNKTFIAYEAIKNHIRITGEIQGKIKCTSCSGDLFYSQADINKHIWAKCECGLGWME